MTINGATSNSFYINQNKANSESVLSKIASARALSSEDNAVRAISSKLGSEISSLGQGLQNANIASSMLNIADGALSTIADSTIKLQELSVRYNNPALNNQQREIVSGEFDKIVESIDLQVKSTSFGGKQLLGSDLNFELGQGSVGVKIDRPDTRGLDISDRDSIDAFMKKIQESRSEVGSSTNAIESSTRSIGTTMVNVAAAQSQISDTDFAQAISDEQTSELLLTSSLIAQAQKTDILKNQMSRLLG